MTRPRHLFSILVIAGVMSAWFALSNHCALGSLPENGGLGFQPMKGQSGSDHRPEADATECPFHTKSSAPEKPKRSNDAPCCKILRAIAVSSAKICARSIVDLPQIDLAFAPLIVIAPPKISFPSATLDTGPPGKTAFAKLIGSMRAHAPPVSV